jgi:drug/metabolite transporter (DMT)-like permease
VPDLEQFIGPLACLSAACLWAFALTWFRPVIARHGAVATNFQKCTLALIVFVAVQLVTHGFALPPGFHDMGGDDWRALLLSGFLGMVVADTFGFLAVVRIGAPLSLLVHLLSPFVSGMLAWIRLGEHMAPDEWLGVSVTVIGIALAIPWRGSPHIESRRQLRLGLLFAFLAMVTNSSAIVWTKPAFEHMGVLPVSSFRLLVCVLVLGGVQLFRGQGRQLLAPIRDVQLRRAMLLATLLGTVGAFSLYNLGIQRSNAGVAAALSGTSPLFAIPVAWLFEKIRPRKIAVLGAFIAFCGAASRAPSQDRARTTPRGPVTRVDSQGQPSGGRRSRRGPDDFETPRQPRELAAPFISPELEIVSPAM